MKTTLIILSIILAGAVEAKSLGGSNIGGGNNGSEYLATWCRNQTSLLRNYRDRARIKVNNTGDYAVANKLLTDGMQQALKNYKSDTQSFLAKSLARGLEISKNLEATSSKTVDRKAMIVNNILNTYYDFMIETVAKDLELNAHIPFIQNRDNNGEMDASAAHFEERFVTYATAQLDWILQNLTSVVRLGNKNVIVPVGDARSLIKVALVLSQGTHDDLDESLWNYRFSCAISDLEVLNESLSSYDQGNREMFDDERAAVDYLGSELNRIARTLKQRTSCN